MALYICKHCGYEGEAKRQTRGSRSVEIMMWTVFTPIAPFYTIWRRVGGKSKQCPNCERQGFVKSSSDEGYIVKKTIEKELGDGAAKPASTQFEAFGKQSSQVEEVKKRQIDPDQF